MITENTPLEKYKIGNKTIYVKREDLFSGGEAPSLSKLRGVKKLVEKLKLKGVKTLGILDTRISKSGWGLAYLCRLKDMNVFCFYPKLKSQTKTNYIQLKEKVLGAEVIGLQAGRINILYSRAKKQLMEIDKKAFMMPLGLVLKETKVEVSKLIKLHLSYFGSVVVCCGTGTICSGIVEGYQKLLNEKKINKAPNIYGVSCGMSVNKIQNRMEKILGYSLPKNVKLIKTKYDYYDNENIPLPFPSSPYYDKKAFKWLLKNYSKLKKPILFWNIGV